MSDDLLRYLSGPAPYSWWWIVLAAILVAAVIGWYAAVLVWTLSPRRLAEVPMVRAVHTHLICRRFTRSLHASGADYRAGRLTAADAAARMGHTLRAFLAVTTGNDVQHMPVGDIAAGDLAPAASVLAALDDARFNPASGVDLDTTRHEAEELVRSWS